MSDLDEDIARGYLENGEPIEAEWGSGWWSSQPEQEPDYCGGECPFCGREAYFIEYQFISCLFCGKTNEDLG